MLIHHIDASKQSYCDIGAGCHILYDSQLLLLACKSSRENHIKFETKVFFFFFFNFQLDNISKL